MTLWEVIALLVGAVALYFRLKSGPLILAGDVAGTVVETGAAVTRFHVGDKITSHLYSKWLDGPRTFPLSSAVALSIPQLAEGQSLALPPKKRTRVSRFV